MTPQGFLEMRPQGLRLTTGPMATTLLEYLMGGDMRRQSDPIPTDAFHVAPHRKAPHRSGNPAENHLIGVIRFGSYILPSDLGTDLVELR